VDPNAALDEILDLTGRITDLANRGEPLPPDQVIRIAELVDALDGWICVGGFLPRRWASASRPTTLNRAKSDVLPSDPA
jgi:hypothetical protein